MRYPNLAKLLREEHKSAGSIRQVCKKAGISNASFYNFTDGDTEPDLETLQKIARGFGVTIGYLVGEEHKSPSPPPELSLEKKMLWDMVQNMTDDEALELLVEHRRKKRHQ